METSAFKPGEDTAAPLLGVISKLRSVLSVSCNAGSVIYTMPKSFGRDTVDGARVETISALEAEIPKLEKLLAATLTEMNWVSTLLPAEFVEGEPPITKRYAAHSLLQLFSDRRREAFEGGDRAGIAVYSAGYAIVRFLLRKGLAGDVQLFVGGLRVWLTDFSILSTDANPQMWVKYANRETITLTFEGAFYGVVNGHSKESSALMEEFIELLRGDGFYYELGDAWNLTLYPA